MSPGGEFWGYLRIFLGSQSFVFQGAAPKRSHLVVFSPKMQVAKQEKKKKKTGRAKRRMQYNRRFVNVVPTFGKKKGPNANS